MRTQREFEFAVESLGGTVFTIHYQCEPEYHPRHHEEKADVTIVGLESVDAETGDTLEMTDFYKLQTPVNAELDKAAFEHAIDEWEKGE